MSASPSLKITLKLSGPRPPPSTATTTTETSQPSSPASKKREEGEGSSSVDSPRKRARPNGTSGGGGRSRKSKVSLSAAEGGTPVPDTPMTVDEDGNSVAADEASTTSNKRGGGGGGGGGGANQANSMTASTQITKKDLLKYKDIKVRSWKSKPLVFYTLDGSEISIPSWQSDEKMNINQTTTEPITVAEIDQLFSSTAGEKDFRPFLCTQPGCSKSFTTFDQLQTHETNMHGTKKLVCGIDGCHKSFVTPGQLTKHRKMVHFRAARKAKLAAAQAAAEAAGETTDTPSISNKDGIDDEERGSETPATTITATNDNDSVDI